MSSTRTTTRRRTSHVIGPGWVVVVTLLGPEGREAIGCTEMEARRVLRLVAEHHAVLTEALPWLS